MTPETPWFIASISKLFVASAVMRLVENGELALEDRIVDRLPSSITHRLHVWHGKDRTNLITLEHLLSHTSGLPDFIEDYPTASANSPADCRSLAEILVEEGDRTWSLEDTAQWVRGRLTPHFAPNSLASRKTRIRYSDTNYQLLIGILEARRKAPFHRVLEDLILAPLGLEHTWVPGRPRGTGLDQEVAAFFAGTKILHLPKFLSSIGDLNSTCDDLVRFLQAVVRGRFFQAHDTWRRMCACWRRFPFPRDRAALRQPSWPIEYGLGVMRFRLPRFLNLLAPLPPMVGHTGSTGTWLFYTPELDLYIVGAVSQLTAAALPFRILPRILRVVMQPN